MKKQDTKKEAIDKIKNKKGVTIGKKPGMQSKDTRSSAIFTKIQEDAIKSVKQAKEYKMSNRERGTSKFSSAYKL